MANPKPFPFRVLISKLFLGWIDLVARLQAHRLNSKLLKHTAAAFTTVHDDRRTAVIITSER